VSTFLWLINAPNSSQKIRVLKFGFKINVSETVSVSNISIDMEDDHKVLIYSCSGLFKIIVGMLTNCHTQYILLSRCNPLRFLSMGLRQGSGLFSSSSRKYPGTEGSYMLQTVWNELDYRFDFCTITKGAHLEHL